MKSQQDGDEDYRVRVAAAHALGKIGDVRAVPMLAASLASISGNDREAAHAALAMIGKAAIPSLRKFIVEQEAVGNTVLARRVKSVVLNLERTPHKPIPHREPAKEQTKQPTKAPSPK
jgi:HEAT repeat protein